MFKYYEKISAYGNFYMRKSRDSSYVRYVTERRTLKDHTEQPKMHTIGIGINTRRQDGRICIWVLPIGRLRREKDRKARLPDHKQGPYSYPNSRIC